MSLYHKHNQSQVSFNDGTADGRFPLKPQNGGSGRGAESFGEDMSRSRGSSNAYANGANQNCGNVITDRSSTRLHAPPGGRSQICFGDDDQEAMPVRRDCVGPNARADDPVAFGANSRKGSNAYANGANQNCGNVLTDRSTTRLHAPPGGRSQIHFGDDGRVEDTRFSDYQASRPGSGAPTHLDTPTRVQRRHQGAGSEEARYAEYERQAPQDDRFAAPANGYGNAYNGQQQQAPPPMNNNMNNARRPPAHRPAPTGDDDRFAVPANGYGNSYAPATNNNYPPSHGQGEDVIFGANSRKGSNAYANGANQNCGNVLTDRSTTRLHAPPGGRSSFRLG